nr:hypothetical protein [Streptococcus gallolyticus]
MKFTIPSNAQTTKLNKHWTFSVGGDHAKQALRIDYIRQLKFIHDELGVDYVRFHGIFTDDMHTLNSFTDILPIPGFPELQERSFYYCGLVYDNILSIGMKPIVELSFMPSVLAEEKETGKMFYGSNFSKPHSFEKWAEHISEFIKYLLNRYGEKEVASWYFEVWNEPDIPVFFKGNQKDYFRLYEVTVKAIKNVNSNIRVGGPVTSGSRWIGDFITFCSENELPVDFISCHQYSGEPLTGISGDEQDIDESSLNPFENIGEIIEQIDSNSSQLDVMRLIFGEPSEKGKVPEDVFKNNSAIVKNQANGLPIIYDEWNFSATFSDYGNDTIKAAAYLVKTALDIEQNVTGTSVWCFSDIFEEMRQFTEEFHGGFGLQTLNGIPKPTFYALKLLTSLAENRIDLGEDATSGEVGIAAFENEDKIQVLLFRQKLQQKDLPAVHVSVSVNTEDTIREVELQRIDQNHCNPLKTWEELGKPKDLRQDEVAKIIKETSLVTEKTPYVIEENTVTVDAQLKVNDIYLFTIHK